MTVSPQDVLRVAELANLELTPEEQTHMLRDLNALLGHFAQLNELETTSVPPMTQAETQQLSSSHTGAAAANLRADEIAPSLSREQVLACAPDTDGIFFKVPKVIER